MVFLVDQGSEFDAPVDAVWRFVSSGRHHSEAHAHRKVRRRRLPNNSGRYSWEQEFEGSPTRFTMRWTAFPPLGVAYDVLEGPFTGSRFFLYYVPRGRKTAVTIVGEFVGPTLAPAQIAPAVRRFFAKEFAQDSAAIRRDLQRSVKGSLGSRG
jgi:hypothetical protein